MMRSLLSRLQSLFLVLLNVFLFVILLVTRDIRFVSILRDKNPEFSEIALLCSDYPGCFRVMPSWIGHTLDYAVGKLSVLISINPDPFSPNPITTENRLTMSTLLVSLFFRIACFIAVWIFLKQVFQSLKLAHMSLIFFQISLSAPQSKMLRYLASLVTEDQRAINWISRSNFVYFVYFDYFALAVSLYLILYLSRIKTFSHPQLFLLGLFLFLSFEYLPMFVALMLIFERVHQSFQKAIAMVLPGLLICLGVFLMSNPSKGLTNTFNYYFENNFSQALAIPLLLSIVLGPAALLGVIFRKLFEKDLGKLNVPHIISYRNQIQSAVIALIFIHFFSLFTSNFLGEFARQSLVLQLLVFIHFSKNKMKKFR